MGLNISILKRIIQKKISERKKVTMRGQQMILTRIFLKKNFKQMINHRLNQMKIQNNSQQNLIYQQKVKKYQIQMKTISLNTKIKIILDVEIINQDFFWINLRLDSYKLYNRIIFNLKIKTIKIQQKIKERRLILYIKILPIYLLSKCINKFWKKKKTKINKIFQIKKTWPFYKRLLQYHLIFFQIDFYKKTFLNNNKKKKKNKQAIKQQLINKKQTLHHKIQLVL
ncbi:hypothetical protein IMG5_160220 [Ichthyophthirius multifiliis]|uniref:Uncharacterized protein n=1 Tax=Ichthyophthirius multifiliis TaxID=5932 RepID=G0QZW1_ICHMU|nr:hypothetical protein IMG5_160220 [Ichthyophthirius multifiliis]EGR29223.1 hypothetical protein IMG5_160220 [Ichthyophthirius multifiliis]|eukprot:XP_004030459.1 hypothetical protein IMG5_160220 [Ichthyophthirius multifiliis]